MLSALKTFSIRLSEDQHTALQSIADTQQIPVSQLIRQAIRKLIEREKHEKKIDKKSRTG